jgi:cytochrome b561
VETSTARAAPTDASADELSVLSFFHYAMGLLVGMLALVPGVFLWAGRELAPRPGETLVLTQGARATDTVTTLLVALLIAVGMAVGALIGWGGRCLARRRRWRVCVLTSFVACLFVPLGTLLGGITLSYLTRRDVRALFSS